MCLDSEVLLKDMQNDEIHIKITAWDVTLFGGSISFKESAERGRHSPYDVVMMFKIVEL